MAGVALWVVLVRLDPGPGPRRLATSEAWKRHEERVSRFRGWPLTLMVGLVGISGVVVAAVGGDFEAGFLGWVCGMIAAFVLTAGLRTLRR